MLLITVVCVPFLNPGGHNFDLSEKMRKIVSLSFFMTFRTFFSFFSKTNRSRVRGAGGSSTLPPVGVGKSGVPVGHGLI